MCRKLMYSVSFLLVLGLVLTNTASAELVGWWKLDDGSGTIAFDSSGNGNDGTLEGNPQWVEGQLGGAWEGSGTDGLDTLSLFRSPDQDARQPLCGSPRQAGPCAVTNRTGCRRAPGAAHLHADLAAGSSGQSRCGHIRRHQRAAGTMGQIAVHRRLCRANEDLKSRSARQGNRG